LLASSSPTRRQTIHPAALTDIFWGRKRFVHPYPGGFHKITTKSLRGNVRKAQLFPTYLSPSADLRAGGLALPICMDEGRRKTLPASARARGLPTLPAFKYLAAGDHGLYLSTDMKLFLLETPPSHAGQPAGD